MNKEAVLSVKKYLFQNRWILLLMILIVFLTHGSILFSQRFGIDTEYIMLGIHNFDMIGRQGLVWLAGLLGLDLGWFNLYYAQVMTILFMILSPVAFGALYHLAGGEGKGESVASLALAGAFVVSPFWTAQIYFLNQSAQVLLACCLAAVAIALAEGARRDIRRKWYLLVGAILLMQAVFSCYQVLIVVYIAGTATVFLLWTLKEDRPLKLQLDWIAFHAGSFTVGFLIYMLTVRLFYANGGGYLQGQIVWAKLGLAGGLRGCGGAILRSLRETPPFYTGMYGLFCLLFLALLFYRLRTERERQGKCVIFLSALFLAASPYVFIFLRGGAIADRMQLVMPLSQGSMLYLTVRMLCGIGTGGQKRLAAVRVLSVILAAAVYKDTLSNLNFCTRLYYTDEWVFQYSVRIAGELYEDVRAVQQAGAMEAIPEAVRDSVVLLGYPEIPKNPICADGHAIGTSLLEFEALAGAFPENQTRRLYFLQNLGYPLDICLTEEEATAFRDCFEEFFGEEVDAMPCYPEPGYVRCVLDEETGLGYLVVKLGEEWRLTE